MKQSSSQRETVCLGWDAPLLPRVADLLQQRFTEGSDWDLSHVLGVLPAARAVRRLDALLQDRADSAGLRLQRPELITTGQLAEKLYEPPKPVALDFEQTLAWARVLSNTDPDQLKPLGQLFPPPEPIGPWLELAGTIRRLHADLAASMLTFSDVVDVAETATEQTRWRLLDGLFHRYLAELERADVVDPHWCRQEMIRAGRCRCEQTLLLIGTSDLSDVQIQMLDAADLSLVACIAAPEDQASRFNSLGCVDTAAWSQHQLPLQDECLVAASDIDDQARAVAEQLAEFGNRYACDQVTVGVTDESHVGPIEIELSGCGVSTYRHLGWTVAQTAIGRLLTLTTAHLQSGTWRSLAALVRHADVHRYVTDQINSKVDSPAARQPEITQPEASQSAESMWLIQLDRLLAEHFPQRSGDELPPTATKAYPLAIAVRDAIDDLLASLLGGERTISAWSESIRHWLTVLYPQQTAPPADAPPKLPEQMVLSEQTARSPEQAAKPATRTEMALQATLRLIDRFAKLNDHLDVTVGGAAALDMFAGRVADLRIGDVPEPADVEILGWLDLALDDAPAMVVNGLNQPFVPASVTSDPFLPGTLRSQLRMADNDRRYARDLYAMHLMIVTRPTVRFIVGRRAADGSPTPPSRLLAAAPAKDAARRIRMLLDQQRPAVRVSHQWDNGVGETTLAVPSLQSTGDVTTMSVTAFRDYLACPYRFYLRHVLKLKPIDDSAGELAANQFGDLIHGAVEAFGESSDKDESDPAKIEASLIEHLHQYAHARYGSGVSTAVNLQIVQAEQRLKIVAQRQAERIAAGWIIHAVEASVDEKTTDPITKQPKQPAGIEVDGRMMGLRGRFDRIDYHPASGSWAILDYKTHGHKPEKKHLKNTDHGQQWIDLQLPLYQLMIPFLGIDAPPEDVSLGYFNISERDEETGIHLAEFTPAQMADAQSLILDCIRGIWAKRFEPTTDRVQFDDYDMILQTGVAQRLLDAVSTEAGSGREMTGARS